MGVAGNRRWIAIGSSLDVGKLVVVGGIGVGVGGWMIEMEGKLKFVGIEQSFDYLISSSTHCSSSSSVGNLTRREKEQKKEGMSWNKKRRTRRHTQHQPSLNSKIVHKHF